TFDRSRREIESKLPAQGERRALVQFTEDDEGGWTKMFAVAKLPSAYLVNAKRQFVWKHEGGQILPSWQLPSISTRFRRHSRDFVRCDSSFRAATRRPIFRSKPMLERSLCCIVSSAARSC